MRKEIVTGVILGFFFSTSSFAVPMTEIWYEVNELDSGRWLYNYEVSNISLTVPIEEFTIWFDFGLYDNLAIETPSSLSNDWDEIVLQSEPVLKDNGAYDAKALGLGIGVGGIGSGFVVSFDWLGESEPGSQFYEIIDGKTFGTIDSGFTIPEPSMLLMLALGGLFLRRRTR